MKDFNHNHNTRLIPPVENFISSDEKRFLIFKSIFRSLEGKRCEIGRRNSNQNSTGMRGERKEGDDKGWNEEQRSSCISLSWMLPEQKKDSKEEPSEGIRERHLYEPENRGKLNVIENFKVQARSNHSEMESAHREIN